MIQYLFYSFFFSLYLSKISIDNFSNGNVKLENLFSSDLNF